jgi:hypothetical protein
MTYEEALAEIETRVEELGGVGKHHAELGAKLATGMALETLEALILAARAARKMLREEHGYEHYRTE